ncbi:divergent polysaccharide deacetylase family protein [Azospirillum sp.]|uniref:divergent polysaccharide deacetylase family protein n=1 Tax=Azospirillum sp. TaxID=34012 RepID=UPI002D35425D|nr:divergent polysaccharide deacetylase family protein [Azospirillum sp.]HYF88588.1 divergent polysaccharide deacetylase family protein [Azospirillum sp.]
MDVVTMARKAPSKARKSPLPPFLSNPFVLALAAVAAVFAVAMGAATLIGGGAGGGAGGESGKPAPVQQAAQQQGGPHTGGQQAVQPPPVPPAKLEPPAAASQPPAQAATESTGQAPAEKPAHAESRPPATAVAMLPPPAPPSQPPVQAPSGNAALWRRNALPAEVPQGKPIIAIVIDDMGLDRKRSTRMAGLRGPLTLSWLPYARDLQVQAKAARANGHELMLHMPMEPSVKADPGPNALLVSLDRGEIVKRARAALDSFDGYVGVNNHMGSRFTADRAALAPVLGELHRRGLLWLDSRTTPNSAGIGLAQELKMPWAGRDIFLDNQETVAAVKAQLAKTEQVAKRQGYAVAIGHPHDATIDALASWLPEVQKRGFVLVPVSAVVRTHHAGG